MKLALYATDRGEPFYASRRYHCEVEASRAGPSRSWSGRALPIWFDSAGRGAPWFRCRRFRRPESDERFGFLQYMEAYQTIRDAIGTDVELGYSARNGLSRYVRAGIEREAIRVF